jgi:hypothetical protein
MNNKSPFNFFIIIAEARSGSSFLKNALSSQKDILFYSLGNLEKKYSSFGKTIQYKNDRKKRTEFRQGIKGSLIIKLAYSILLKKRTNQKLFGFKGHPERILSVPNYFQFLSQKNARVIFLTRTNALLRFISLETAKKVGSSSSSIKNEKALNIFELNPVHINYDEFISHNAYKEKIEKEILLNINKHNLPYLRITYEELSENFDESFNKIFDFLDLNKNTIINVKSEDGRICHHKKINTYKLKDKIINYEEFKKIAEDKCDTQTLNFLKEK